jgi:hypothetical protein
MGCSTAFPGEDCNHSSYASEEGTPGNSHVPRLRKHRKDSEKEGEAEEVFSSSEAKVVALLWAKPYDWWFSDKASGDGLVSWRWEMSEEKFEEDCYGCRPAILDAQTGTKLPDDHPVVVMANKVYDSFSREEKEAYHRFCCQNSRAPGDVAVAAKLAKGIEQAAAN